MADLAGTTSSVVHAQGLQDLMTTLRAFEDVNHWLQTKFSQVPDLVFLLPLD